MEFFGNRCQKRSLPFSYSIRCSFGFDCTTVTQSTLCVGTGFKIDIPVLPWTDEQMIQGMAMENATGEEESVEAQVDVIQLAGKHLVKKFEEENLLFDAKKKCFVDKATIAQSNPKERHIEAGSEYRIAPFLGEKNWSRRKVSDPINLSLK